MLTQLILEAKELPQVSRAAAQSYQEKIQVLEEWVNEELGSYPGTKDCPVFGIPPSGCNL
jgi:hypothetical protein